jgi:hypothetical protein
MGARVLELELERLKSLRIKESNSPCGTMVSECPSLDTSAAQAFPIKANQLGELTAAKRPCPAGRSDVSAWWGVRSFKKTRAKMK